MLWMSLHSFGQREANPCGFDVLYNNDKILLAEQKIQSSLRQGSDRAHDIKIIPVVVHIFHEGGAENISVAQVESQIVVLNEDYGKLSGSNGDGNGVDTEVRFQLAKIDPNGNCSNGIVRINSPLTNHQTYERPLLKEISFWDNEKYMNIYIVKSIPGGTLGYSSFPGGPADEDGMVIRHNYFGTTGTASSTLGRTGTHEVGHWLGIYHTFNNGCGVDICTDGDYVCDTPPVATANFGCTTSNSCSNDNPNLPDQIENYMDYTSETCSNMFTQGQADRMHATLNGLRQIIWSQSNLVATGCDSAYVAPAICPVVANYTSLNPEICVNNSVQFTDISLNGATNWTWYFEGGTPATSTLQNPVIAYNTLGSFDVSLVVDNGSSSDSINKNDFISVNNPGIGEALPFQESFDSGIFPPNGITINNPDGGIAWELDSNAYTSPNYSIRLDNLTSTNYGTIDEIILPFLDLTSIGTTPFMKFNWAYAKSVSLYSDEMIVQLSIDCGATWTQIYYKANTNLVTGPTQTTPFIPTDSQWKKASINLGNYASETYVLIKIMNVTDGGNYLYIDDINIGDIGLGVDGFTNGQNFKLYPNPNNGQFFIEKATFDESSEFSIYDMSGKLIKKIVWDGNAQKIEINGLQKGAYLIVNNNGINLYYQKVIIQ